MSEAESRIQLCGRLVVRLEGERVDGYLPGSQGRLLVGFLALNRTRYVNRAELVEAIWGERLPSAPDTALRALLSKLRSLLGAGRLEGKGELRLILSAHARAIKRGRKLAIVEGGDAVRRIFKITGVLERLNFVDAPVPAAG